MAENSQWPDVAKTTVTTWGGVEPSVQITALIVFMVICVAWIYLRKPKVAHGGGIPIEAFTAIVNELNQSLTAMRDAVEDSNRNFADQIKRLSETIIKSNHERCAACRFGAFSRELAQIDTNLENDGG
jgi:hypothetical protein